MATRELTFKVNVDPTVAAAAMTNLTRTALVEIQKITNASRQLNDVILSLQRNRTTSLSSSWRREQQEWRINEATKLRDFQRSIQEVDRAERRRLAEAIRSANQRLREERRTAREIERINRETARQAEQQERLRERAAKQLADVRIREAKRTARELEKSLSDSSGGGSSLILGLLGRVPALSGVTSELSALTSASSAAGGSVAAAGGSIAAIAGPIAIAAAGLAALAAGTIAATRALIDLTKHTADFEGKMLDLSQATAFGVETLSTLEVAARTTGGSLDSIAASLGIFQRHLEEAQDPASTAADTLRELGVTATDTELSLRQTLSALAAMPEGAEQTATALELFGRGGRQVLAILKETNGDLDALQDQLRKTGILITSDAARAADRLNDELALLDFQIRAASADLSREFIPVLRELAHSLADLLRAANPVLKLFGEIGSTVSRPLTLFFKGMSLFVRAATSDYKELARAIREMNEEAEKSKDIPPITVPSPTPVALPGPPSTDAATRTAASEADSIVSTVQRTVAAQAQVLSELFERGRIDRQKQTEETIVGNRRVLEAEQARIDVLLKLKDVEVRTLRERDDLSAAERQKQLDAAFQEAQKLQQQRLDAESTFETTSRELRARAAKEAADSRRNEEQNATDQSLRLFDRQIQAIETQIQRQEIAEEQGLTVIEAIEKAKITVRKESLKKQKEFGFLTVENQKELDRQIARLGEESDQLREQQIQRRLQRERGAFERLRQQLLDQIQSLLEAERIAGEEAIAAIEARAAQRIITEENAARTIRQIRLDLNRDEIEAIQAQIEAAKSIGNVDERAQVESELNNRFRLLFAERKHIQSQGNRDVAAARQVDLDNLRRYADELRSVQRQISDVAREAAAESINLMSLKFARHRDIIRAQLDFDLKDENTQHKRALAEIEQLQEENRRSTRTQVEKFRIEQELNRLREAEEKRHRLAIQGIREKGKQDEDEASPFSRIGLGTNDLKKFASVIESSVVPLNQLLTRSFLDVADAIGQTIATWVLLGETGPAVMRKILAQALASIAAEATVNAIKELALGFATLFFNPAESAAHFTAAALWGSIGGVAALAGRGVAGDLFKQDKNQRRSDSSRDASQLNPLSLERNTSQQREMVLKILLEQEVKSNDSHIVKTIVKDFQTGGKSREAIINDGVVTV